MPFSRAIGLTLGAAVAIGEWLALLARGLGLFIGLLAVAYGLHAWSISSAGTALGADIGVVATPPGELELSSSGYALYANGLRANSAPVDGSLALRNITGVPVRVRIRALPSNRELDRVLRFTAAVRGRRVADGPIGVARRWSARSFPLAAGASVPVAVRIALGANGDSIQGLIADVTLEFRVTAVKR